MRRADAPPPPPPAPPPEASLTSIFALLDAHDIPTIAVKRVMDYLPASAIAALACVSSHQQLAMRLMLPKGLLHGMHATRKRWLAEQLVHFIHLCKQHADNGMHFGLTITHADDGYIPRRNYWSISFREGQLKSDGSLQPNISFFPDHAPRRAAQTTVLLPLDKPVAVQVKHMERLLAPIKLTRALRISITTQIIKPHLEGYTIDYCTPHCSDDNFPSIKVHQTPAPTLTAALAILSSPEWQRTWTQVEWQMGSIPSLATLIAFIKDVDAFSRRASRIHEAADAPALPSNNM
jgi:hypothetical protein